MILETHYYHFLYTDDPTYPADGCPAGWVDGGHLGCFLFLSDYAGVSWLEGLEVCEAAGGWLAEPRTEEQRLFLSSIAYVEETLTGVRGWWAGLHFFTVVT